MTFDRLKNPTKNVVTTSFYIETYTSDNYKLDELKQNMTVNFFCMYPCASCSETE